MSLNYKEIDLILSEIPFKNARIQEIYQSTIQSMYIELYIQQTLFRVHMCLSPNNVSIHLVNKKANKPKTPQRFQQLLQSKIIGMYINSCIQIDENRIIKMHLKKKQNTEDVMLERFLYFKLWSNNTNIIFTDKKNIIIDLLYRSPKQNLMPKNVFVLPEPSSGCRHNNTVVRKWTGTSFNTFIAGTYLLQNKDVTHQYTKEKILAVIDEHLLQLSNKGEKIDTLLEHTKNYKKYTDYGNIILESLHTILPQATQLLDIDDKPIVLNPKISPVENAHFYFKKAKKSERTCVALQKQIKECKKELDSLVTLQKKVTNYTQNILETTTLDSDVLLYVKSREKKKVLTTQTKKLSKKTYGIRLKKDGFLIFIGRNAQENDMLLRHVAHGEDMWMHVYENRGGFVFIRTHKNQTHTIPLSLLLECAQLAVLYSKAKKNSTADIYYTKTKYVRRVKKTIGLVIPSQTKTLHIKVNIDAAKIFIQKHAI